MSSVLRPLKELIDINYTYRSFMHGFIKVKYIFNIFRRLKEK